MSQSAPLAILWDMIISKGQVSHLVREIVIDDLGLTQSLQEFLVVSCGSTEWGMTGAMLMINPSLEVLDHLLFVLEHQVSLQMWEIVVRLSLPDLEPPVFAVPLWFSFTEATFASKARGLPESDI